MIKHFKWRLAFDKVILPVKVESKPQVYEEVEINYLHGKTWLPTNQAGSIQITLFEPHDLWQGEKDVRLILQDMHGEDIEYWMLKDATVNGWVVTYKEVHYYESIMSKKDKKKLPPREVPPRDDYYMGEAFWIASKSKDPRTQVGARIVSEHNDPISTGYNDPPKNINDNAIDWDRPAKYPFVIHAEDNAIKRAKRKGESLRGATLYVTAPPCKACMLDIVEAEITRVVYFRPKTDSGSLLANDEEWATTQEIARLGCVRLDQYQGNLNWMRDRIAWMESIGVFG